MKKILFILTILAVALSVSACGSQTSQSVDNQPTGSETVTPTGSAPDQTNSNNNSAADNTVAPADNSTATSSDQTAASVTPVDNTTTMKSPNEQESLLAKYSEAVIKTSLGNITVKFYAADAPVTVNNFLNLAKAGFYDGTKFHRVIKDFMIQGGDPLSKGSDTSVWGTGGPGYQFDDETNSHLLVAGSLAMANSGSNTNGSQFFIVTATSTPWLDGHYNNFGEVVSGMDVVKKIEATPTVNPGVIDRPITDVVINSVELK